MRLICAVAILGSTLVSIQARAQRVTDLVAGVRVRVSGNRTTNEGIRRFSLDGRVVSQDSMHLVLATAGTGIQVDTILLEGVRHLDTFQGLRERRSMILTGALLGTMAGVGVWWFVHQTQRPAHTCVIIDASRGSACHDVSEPVAPIVGFMRNSIPIWIGAGSLAGATIGRERWAPIAVPQSLFPEAHGRSLDIVPGRPPSNER